ncbi:MAG: hypothetical protein ACRCWR_06175 [Saezia sp.]
MWKDNLNLYISLCPVESVAIIREALDNPYKKGNVYLYNSLALKEAYDLAVDFRSKKIPPYHPMSQLDAFNYQYDIEISIGLEYDKYKKREIELIDEKINNTAKADPPPNQARWIQRKEDVLVNGFTGIKRIDHIYNACAIRWPVGISGGRYVSEMIRNPWSDRIITAILENTYTICFGGAGVGKTNVLCLFGVLVFDHYSFTEKGARIVVSSKDRNKLAAAAFSTITRQYFKFPDYGQFSLMAGLAQNGKTLLIRRRPGDEQSVILGFLANPNQNADEQMASLTGAHGLAQVAIIDEFQASSEAPLMAASNMMQSCPFGRIICSANWDESSAQLISNIEPLQGWSMVDKTTGSWQSRLVTGATCQVLHFNNDDSPAIVSNDPARLNKWGFLPTLAKKEIAYPTPESRLSGKYFCQWEGLGGGDIASGIVNYIVDKRILGENQRSEPIKLREEVRLMSFDPAPAQTDRNLLLKGAIVNDDRWKTFLSFRGINFMEVDVMRYFELMGGKVVDIAKEYDVDNAGITMDNTSISSIRENLIKAGYDVYPIIYNENTPKGKGGYNKFIKNDGPFIVGYHVEGHPIWNLEVGRRNDEVGFWLLQQYLKHNQLRGFSDSLLTGFKNGGFDAEFCKRTCSMDGQRIVVQKKSQLRNGSKLRREKGTGFSTDCLDVVMMMCLLACKVYGFIPGTNISLNRYQKNQREQLRARDIRVTNYWRITV